MCLITQNVNFRHVPLYQYPTKCPESPLKPLWIHLPNANIVSISSQMSSYVHPNQQADTQLSNIARTDMPTLDDWIS